jgi:hypothetical protein
LNRKIYCSGLALFGPLLWNYTTLFSLAHGFFIFIIGVQVIIRKLACQFAIGSWYSRGSLIRMVALLRLSTPVKSPTHYQSSVPLNHSPWRTLPPHRLGYKTTISSRSPKVSCRYWALFLFILCTNWTCSCIAGCGFLRQFLTGMIIVIIIIVNIPS